MPEKQGINKNAHEKLKWDTAKELGLDDDLTNPGDELTSREAGKIGGNMVRKLIKAGNDSLDETREHK